MKPIQQAQTFFHRLNFYVLIISATFAIQRISQLDKNQIGWVIVLTAIVFMLSAIIHSIESGYDSAKSNRSIPVIQVMYSLGLAYTIFMILSSRSLNILQDAVFSQSYSTGDQLLILLAASMLIPIIVKLVEELFKKLSIKDSKLMLAGFQIGLIFLLFHAIIYYNIYSTSFPRISQLIVGIIPLGWIYELYVRPITTLAHSYHRHRRTESNI